MEIIGGKNGFSPIIVKGNVSFNARSINVEVIIIYVIYNNSNNDNERIEEKIEFEYETYNSSEGTLLKRSYKIDLSSIFKQSILKRLTENLKEQYFEREFIYNNNNVNEGIIWVVGDGEIYAFPLFSTFQSRYKNNSLLTKSKKLSFYRNLPFSLTSKNSNYGNIYKPNGATEEIISDRYNNITDWVLNKNTFIEDVGMYILASPTLWNDNYSWDDVDYWNDYDSDNVKIYNRGEIDLDLLRDRRKIYVRFLNSLGGWSYRLLNVSAIELKTKEELIERDYFVNDNDAVSNTIRIDGEAYEEITAGCDMLTITEFEDLQDIQRSLVVQLYDVESGRFIGCNCITTSTAIRKNTYQDFTVKVKLANEDLPTF